MDILDELSRMADLVTGQDSEPSEQKIQQWQRLFSYSRAVAIDKINERAMDFSRQTISDEIWNEVKADWISKGYDKDAYEHYLETSISIHKKPTPLFAEPALSSQEIFYLVKLDGQISSPEAVQDLLGSETLPDVMHDEDNPTIRFCYVSAKERGIIEAKVSPKPTFISLGSGPSPKALDPDSRYPTLGIETTLPQYRATDGDSNDGDSHGYEPRQDQYPVWYFFYGNLANPKILGPRIGVDEQDLALRLTRATIHGGKLASWRGKYKALLNGDPDDKVSGWDFMVVSKEVEDWLRKYETSAYEVVRCQIERQDGSLVPGCVFRFCGDLSV